MAELKSDIATLESTALSSWYIFIYVRFFLCLLIFCGYTKETVLAVTECDCSYSTLESDGSLESNNVAEAGVSDHKRLHTVCWIILYSPLSSIHPFCNPLPLTDTHTSTREITKYYFIKAGSWGVQKGWCFYSLQTSLQVLVLVVI